MKRIKLRKSKREQKKIDKEKKKRARKKGKHIVFPVIKKTVKDDLILRREMLMNMTISELKIYLREKYSLVRSTPTVEAIMRLIDHHDKITDTLKQPAVKATLKREPRQVSIRRAKRK